MHIKTYKTHPVTVNESLLNIIDAYIPKLNEQSIFVITSKVVSLCEGSIVKKTEVSSKEALIYDSADAYLDCKNEQSLSHPIQLTIKNNILIPSAGIDESNGNGVYILYPKNVQLSAISIWEYLRKRDDLSELGVLITDSHTTPMRRGVIGIGLGWCGFKPLYNYIGQPDCFGNPLLVTMANNLDAIAAAAVFCMGEGNEQTPFAVVLGAPKIEFQSTTPTDAEIQQISVSIDEDLYAPLLKNTRWISKNKKITTYEESMNQGNNSWINNLEKLIQQKHMLSHPFYQAWMAGTLERSTLQMYAKEYYQHVKAFPTYISALHSHCENPKIRRQLLTNLMDEEAGTPNHLDLWKSFTLALGVNQTDLDTHKPQKATQELIDTFRKFCCSEQLVLGLAALYCYESQIPAICRTKIDGLKRWYGLLDPESYHYFSLHETMDIEHSYEEKELLLTLVGKDEEDAVLACADRILTALWNFLSSFAF